MKSFKHEHLFYLHLYCSSIVWFDKYICPINYTDTKYKRIIQIESSQIIKLYIPEIHVLHKT